MAGIEAFKARIQGILGKVEAQTAYNKGKVEVYTAMSQARAIIYEVFARGVDLEIKQALADIDVRTKELDERIKALVETYGVHKIVVEGGAKVAAQLCAAALGSVNVNAGMAYQSQESVQESAQTVTESRESGSDDKR